MSTKTSHKYSIEEIRTGCITAHKGDPTETRLCTINAEFRNAMNIVRGIKRSVTFFGSSRTKEGTTDYLKAMNLAKRISSEIGFTIVTGGGPGIMAAANRGAFETGGESVGFTIKLPMEQTTNLFLTKEASFYYFFTRKVALSFAADAYVVFPGGFGTLDEMTEILTLIQSKKIERVPIILVGVEFWTPLFNFFRDKLLDSRQAILLGDLDLFTLTDTEDEIIEIIKNSPQRARD